MSLASATIEAKELSFVPLATEEKSCLRQNYISDVKIHSYYKQFIFKAMLKSSTVKTNQPTEKNFKTELSVLVSSIISNTHCLCISLYSPSLVSSRLRK